MSKIVDALKCNETPPEDFWIADHERKTLIEMLTFIAGASQTGRVYFNQKGVEHQRSYIDLCRTLAVRFANMPVKEEQ